MEQTDIKPRSPKALCVERHRVGVFWLMILAMLLPPVSTQVLGSWEGKQARRRRIGRVTISLLLIPLLLVSPQELCALQAQATMYQLTTALPCSSLRPH